MDGIRILAKGIITSKVKHVYGASNQQLKRRKSGWNSYSNISSDGIWRITACFMIACCLNILNVFPNVAVEEILERLFNREIDMVSAVEQMAANTSWAALGKANDLRKRIFFTWGC